MTIASANWPSSGIISIAEIDAESRMKSISGIAAFCTECGGSVGIDEHQCPHCGHLFSTAKSKLPDGDMPENIETKVALIERDIEYLRRNDDNERAELRELRDDMDSMRKEFDKLNQNYSNLLARGVGFTGAIVAVGAVFGWVFQYGAKIFKN